jgi:hypothetical protein
MSNVLLKDCVSFRVRGKLIDFYSEEMDHGLNTVAEYDGKYIYLGNMLPNIVTAIHIWQQNNNYKLNSEDIVSVLKENNLLKNTFRDTGENNEESNQENCQEGNQENCQEGSQNPEEDCHKEAKENNSNQEADKESH